MSNVAFVRSISDRISENVEKVILGKHFRLLRGPLSVPFVIRETRRKFQHTLSEVSIWERR